MNSNFKKDSISRGSDQIGLLLWDGNCGFCTLAHKVLNEKDQQSFLKFRKLQDTNLSKRGPYKNRDFDTLYFISKQGVKFTHARAFFEAMAVLPGVWGVVGRAFANRFFGFIGYPFYRVIAENRGKISQLLRLMPREVSILTKE
jgi:predicted DCC family thiol-disulfide oxidoreductase YuxK